MRITVFAGSSMGSRPEFAAAAADLGRVLAEAGVGIVYGGSSVGLMGVLARAAMAAGGEVLGGIPQVLVDAEVAAPGITRPNFALAALLGFAAALTRPIGVLLALVVAVELVRWWVRLGRPGRLAGLAVRARVRSSREGSRCVRK